MNKAKAAVSEFLHDAGHRDTTVHERVAPAVVQETVHQQKVEEVQTAVEKEIHQDHYHTSVQPVFDREVLPEKHVEKIAAVEHRHFEHGNKAEVEARIAKELAGFHDERTVVTHDTERRVMPVVGGETIHHHVHEIIQPVVQKEVIQPEVIHTVIPIHEVHHNAPQVHGATTLPPVSLADFKAKGGDLRGRGELVDGFEGEPRSLETLGATGLAGSPVTGVPRHDSGVGMGTGTGIPRNDSGVGLNTIGTGSPTGTHHATTGTHKGGLLAKLNPKVDSDGDGKAGFLK